AIAGGRFPLELAARVLALVAHPAGEHVRVVAEAAKELRQLRRMAERVRDVGDPRRSPELARAAQPLLQVAHDGLARDEEEVGEDVPRPDEEPRGPAERRPPLP